MSHLNLVIAVIAGDIRTVLLSRAFCHVCHVCHEVFSPPSCAFLAIPLWHDGLLRPSSLVAVPGRSTPLKILASCFVEGDLPGSSEEF